MAVYYTGTFASTGYGDNLKWEIIGPASPGNTAVTPAGRGHTTVTWQASEEDEFAPLMPSEARISFYDTAGDAVLGTMFNAIADQEYAYTLKITNTDTGNVVWIGYLETGAIERDEDGNKVTVLTATDGLRRLEEIYYSTDEALTLYTGRATVLSILLDLLNRLGFSRDIYTACNLYPLKTAPQLAATADPLASIYVDRGAFRTKDVITKPIVGNRESTTKDATYYAETDFAPIRCSEVLSALLRRFGLRICQWNGAWHVVQQDLLYNGSYRRWHYNSAGTPQSPAYEDFTSAVTPTDESAERSPGTIASLPPWSAVRMDYRHGTTQILRNPNLDVDWTQGIAPWYTTGVIDPLAIDEGNLGWKSAVLRYTYGSDLDPTQGSLAGSWDFIINAAVAGNLTGTLTYDSSGIKAGGIVVPLGTQMWPNVSFRIDPTKAYDLTGVAQSKKWVTLQIKITDGGSNTHYLQSDGSWSTSVTWLVTTPVMGYNNWIPLKDGEDAIPTDALPYDAYVVVTLGPCFEESKFVGSTTPGYMIAQFVWDSAQLVPVVGGVYNPEVTSTVNYVDRTRPKIKEVAQYLGDGPISASETGLSTNASGTIDGTSDWEQGAGHSGASTGDSIDDLLSRIHLRAQRYARRKHSALYHGLDSIPGPIETLERDGAQYAALSMTVDYADDTVQGTWVKLVQAGFTDDLETGVYSAGRGFGAWGADGSSGFILERLADTFFTEASKRVAVTTAVIAAGATTSITVASDPDNAAAGIVEPLLKADDRVVLIAPDLSYHILTLSANQAAAATTIAIDSYTFPEEVPYPASIFFVEDELLTLARLGEQGFAVTVNATPLGKVNLNQTGITTSVNVKEWIGSVDTGGFVYLSDGTKLTLTADARAEATSLSFSAISPKNVVDGDPIYANGQVRRSEFLVASDKITAYIERTGDQIAVVQTNSSDTTIPVLSLSMDLFVGDYIFITRVNSAEEEPGSSPGEVIKAKVAAAATASGSPTSIQVTTNTVVYPGDIITPSYLAGVRVDQDGVIIRHSHLMSEDWLTGGGVVSDAGVISNTGTTGWIISASGEAVFNDVTVRGTIEATAGYFRDGSLYTLATDGASSYLDYSVVWAAVVDGAFFIAQNADFPTVGIATYLVKLNKDEFVLRRNGVVDNAVYLAADSELGTVNFLYAPTFATSYTGIGVAATASTLLADPGADRILFWDDSAGTVAWLTVGTNLSISGTTLNATAGGVSTLDDVGDVALTAVAQGDILYRNGASEWANLPAGTSGRVLKTQGAGANPLWGTLASSDLSDAANIAHVNATESIGAAWTFGLTNLKLANVTTGATTLNANDPAGNITITLPLLTGTLYATGNVDVAVADGGTGKSSWTTNGIVYASGTTTLAQVSVNATATAKFLKQVSSGVPSFETIAAADLSDGANIAHINANETITGAWSFGGGANLTVAGTSYFRFSNVTSGYTTFTAADSGTIAVTLPSASGTLLTSADSVNAFADVTITSAAEGNTLVHDGSAWINAAPAWHNVYSMYTQDSTASDSQTSIIDQTAVGSRTIAAGTLKAGTIVHFRAWGTVTTDTENLTLRFFFNTTGSGTEAFSLAGPTTDSLNAVAWTLDVWCVVKTTGGSGTMQVSGRYWVNGAEAAITPAHVTSQQETIDTTAANTINLTAQWSAAGTSTIYCDHAAIDMTRQAF